MTDIEQMKAELEASGYKIRIQGTISSVITPDDMEIHLNDWASHDTPQSINARLVKQAYAHLQERKELEALRALYQLNEELFSYAEMYMEDGSYPRRNRSDDSATDITYGALRRIYSELLNIRQYNITADDESDDDDNS